MLRRRCRVQGGAEIPKPGGRYLRRPDVTVFSKQIGQVATDAVLSRVGQPLQCERRMMLQKLARTNLASLSARTSAFTLDALARKTQAVRLPAALRAGRDRDKSPIKRDTPSDHDSRRSAPDVFRTPRQRMITMLSCRWPDHHARRGLADWRSRSWVSWTVFDIVVSKLGQSQIQLRTTGIRAGRRVLADAGTRMRPAPRQSVRPSSSISAQSALSRRVPRDHSCTPRAISTPMPLHGMRCRLSSGLSPHLRLAIATASFALVP
jgi:hypothetical protein